MPINAGSVLERRRLGAELARLRDEAGLTMEGVAERVDITRSKLGRIEKGKSSVAAADLNALLRLYGVSGTARAELERYVRGGNRRGANWWARYNETLSAGYAEFLAFEAEAAVARQYQPLIVPGLLQTEAYARATHATGFFAFGPDQVDDLVEIRMLRQRRLTDEDGLELHAFMTEAALNIQLGGAAGLRGQLQHLLSAAELPNVTVQIVPYTSQSLSAHTSGATLFDFPDSGDPSVAFLDVIGGNLLRDDLRDVRRIARVFENLANSALSPAESMDLVARKLEELL
ncbi:helix-turn-helix domain-containing protein [Yinghuangia soli]|uniref:Helix-turn-helix domain-containing protein n=1 Tax=Yinghuangia soli TaxID=2908204 RepID=A0AA41PUL7_9ACTN|nr:helix-turn-helix transcriptional regulator [Yinghuangia soli]MCF2526038.1 helix-turn-helix domain-containing protein [Yinghuangia soli]